ncbi:hypothetical protein LJC27_00635 [Christensenellaceae bacterium OttesenSCG-928-M15]|nr:hypothetical protein [Christensenellaceae bacterium OttesenSCG-928-M15]
MNKKLIAYLLSAALMVSGVTGCATGGQEDVKNAGPSFIEYQNAAEISAKSEVVYGNLQSDGSVEAVYIVNILDVKKAGTIEEYGEYSEVINLTDTAPVTLDRGVVAASGGKGRFYYQGNVEAPQLPWEVMITYRLDGREIDPALLGGADGELEVHIVTKRNTAYDEGYFDNYLLQVSVTLDMEHAQNIQAPGGTKAYAGNNAMLTYTVMPGKEADIRFSATVTDFYMEGISLSAVPLSMFFDDIDTESMTGEMDELVDAVGEMNDGVKELYDGTKDLKSGVSDLKKGTGDLTDGVFELKDGSFELMDGIGEFYDGIVEFSDGIYDMKEGAEELFDGSEEFESGLGEYLGGVGKLVPGSEKIRDALNLIAGAAGGSGGMGDLSALSDLPTGLVTLAESIEELEGGLSGAYMALDAAIGNLASLSIDPGDIAALGSSNPTVNALIAYYQAGQAVVGTYGVAEDAFTVMVGDTGALKTISGTLRYTAQEVGEGLAGLGDLPELMSGLVELSANYGDFHAGLLKLSQNGGKLMLGYIDMQRGIYQFSEGTKELYDGAVEIRDGAWELYDGSKEFYDGVVELYDGVVELDDGVGDLYSGTGDLKEGVYELYDGTTELYDGVKELPDEVQKEVDKLLKEYDKSDFRPISFASAKNGTIAAVQFVMQTAKIAAPEKEEVPQEIAVDKNVVDRFLDLFR